MSYSMELKITNKEVEIITDFIYGILNLQGEMIFSKTYIKELETLLSKIEKLEDENN